uniref:Protein LTV1 homolog n=1 Tax=Theileria annulata TaxID=5874 RepID=A0A3B0MGA9_THEAN
MVKEKKSVTFQLVSASNADNRSDKLPWQRTLVLKESQNDIWKNRNPSQVPKDLLKNLDPHDFGIHDNLNKTQKQLLIRNIYGNLDTFKKFDKPTKKQTKQKVAEDDLEGDCYFPKDGYDYEQHLATINPKYFIPAPKHTNDDPYVEISADFPDLNDSLEGKLDPEVGEVLEALESDNELEAIDDDFVSQAIGCEEDLDEDDLLWGNYTPMIPISILDNINNHEIIEDNEEISDDMIENPLERGYLKDFNHYNALDKDKMTILDPIIPKDKIYEILENDEHFNEISSESDFDDEYEYESSESDNWDVETVLTTYSNSTNHPKMILSRKIKVPNPAPLKDNSANKKLDIDTIQLPEVNTTRVKGESLEEKRERKLAVKRTKALIQEVKRNNKEILKEVRRKNAVTNSKGCYDITNGVKYLKL